MLHAYLGNHDEAIAQARQAEALNAASVDAWGGASPDNYLVVAYSVAGMPDEAMAAQARLTESRTGPSSTWMEMHPYFDQIRSHSGFAGAVEARRAHETPVS